MHATDGAVGPADGGGDAPAARASRRPARRTAARRGRAGRPRLLGRAARAAALAPAHLRGRTARLQQEAPPGRKAARTGQRSCEFLSFPFFFESEPFFGVLRTPFTKKKTFYFTDMAYNADVLI